MHDALLESARRELGESEGLREELASEVEELRRELESREKDLEAMENSLKLYTSAWDKSRTTGDASSIFEADAARQGARAAQLEAECARKDTMETYLRAQIAGLQTQLRAMGPPQCRGE